MERETFYSRLVKLMQKSRKALRLYSQVGRIHTDSTSHFSDAQVQEWKNVNSELLRQLSMVMDRPNSRTLVSEVLAIRDYFQHNWRTSEAELHERQRELISCAENGDFVKAAVLSETLVTLKARMQAAQAAHHEFSEVLIRSNIHQPTIELSSDKILKPELQEPVNDTPLAKVIPLRKVSNLRR